MKLLDPYPPVRIVTSYAHEDQDWLDVLHTVFEPFARSQPAIEAWDDRKILPGALWNAEITQAFNRANVFLFLLSPDALTSTYILENELVIAKDRAQKGVATIVPIIVRPCVWEYTDFARFQALPTNGQPISLETGGKREQVLKDITLGLVPLLASVQEKMKATS